jgi:hypothetical protein
MVIHHQVNNDGNNLPYDFSALTIGLKDSRLNYHT